MADGRWEFFDAIRVSDPEGIQVKAERDYHREALERVTEAYADPKRMVGIAWEALGG